MVVVVYHLPFIQGKGSFLWLRQEEMAVVGHMQECPKFNPPRIFFHILPHQDGCAAVELLAQAGVFATPEERAGARIRVDQAKSSAVIVKWRRLSVSSRGWTR